MDIVKIKGGPYLCQDKGIKGYRYYVTLEDGRKIAYARYVLMQSFCTPYIPRKFVVHHINGNTLNDTIENLKLIKNEEHASLHHPRGSQYGVSPADDFNAWNRAYHKARRLNNDEEWIARQRQYSARYKSEHKEQIAQRHKLFYLKNKERLLLKKKQYRESHKEQLLLKQRQYRKRKKEERNGVSIT